MLRDHRVRRAEVVRAIAQAKAQHYVVGEGEVEHYDVAAEEHVADEDFSHVVVGLHAGGVDLREGGAVGGERVEGVGVARHLGEVPKAAALCGAKQHEGGGDGGGGVPNIKRYPQQNTPQIQFKIIAYERLVRG